MLVEKTLFGTEDKISTAIERLKYFEPPEGYYLAFSGGKDSAVIKALADMAMVKYDAHHNLTTIDPPELIYFIRKYHGDVIIDRPEKHLLTRMIEQNIPPMRNMRWCCAEYKERGGTGRLVITGIRKAESVKRRRRALTEQCLTDRSKKLFNPIVDWTEDDVWQFIRENDLPYCSLYDEGWKRIGCLFCPCAGKHRLIEAERYPRYVKMFIKAFELLYIKQKSKGNPIVSRWKSGEENFWWWLKDDRKRKEPDQLMMFE